jgi:cob(I)alamin adenosyltransferase
MGKRLGKIYTRTGDQGDTGLGDGKRVAKDDARVEAIGAVDELNAWLGVVVQSLHDEGGDLAGIEAFLRGCQHRIFDLGGELSIPGYKIISEDHVAAIERQLDELNEGLEPLANFILPGGSRLIAELHIARTVCRRAERRLVTLASGADINADGLKLLNRLSDYLFVAARYCAKVTGTPEILWEQG